MSAAAINGHLTEADGRRLALDMLRNFDEANVGDRYSNRAREAECRDPGAAQDTGPLRRYLDAYGSASAAVQEGFLQVLSGMLDDWACGCMMSVDALEEEALQ